MKHEKKKKLTEWPKQCVLRRLGPFSSSPPPPFLLSVIIKTYINNTLVSIKIRKKNLLLWPKRRVWRRLGLPPVMVLLWVMVAVVVVVVGCHGLSTLASVVGCRCCRCCCRCECWRWGSSWCCWCCLLLTHVILNSVNIVWQVDALAKSRDMLPILITAK